MSAAGDLVAQLVVAVRAWGPSLGDSTVVETAERAVIDGRDGLVILWTQRTRDQGTRQFGLLADADELARFAGRGIDRLVADLHLMATEPHGTTANEHTRTWFRSVADFVV